jgi:putative ABC transport system ATP-binding protein
MSNSAFIRLVGVTRTYRTGAQLFYALKDISLSIAMGEFVAIVGPSGSGKSTLLNLIAGIDKPTVGEIWVGGLRIDRLDEDALARWRGHMIGIVFQFFQLLPTLTVLENVALPLQLRQLWASPSLERAKEALARVGLGNHADKLPSELSGGEKQRAAIARALINDPPILIADEPTGNLDSSTGEQVIDLMVKQHRTGKTVILVTHEPRLAEIASRQIHLLDGRIAEDSSSPLSQP